MGLHENVGGKKTPMNKGNSLVGGNGNEERYRAILQQVSDCIALIDVETKRYVETNKAFRELLGYSLEELSGMSLYDIVEYDPVVIDDNTNRILQNGSYFVGERQYRHKDGFLVDVEVSVNVVSYGEKKLLCNVIRDITERKQAEKALRDSEDKYRAIFDTTGTATIIIEKDTTISLANTEFEKLSGHTREEIEGKKSWAEFFAPEYIETMKQYHYRRRIDPGSAPRNYEAAFRNRWGGVRYVLLTVGMIPGTERSIASILDITERKSTEESLRLSEEKYRTVIESTSDSILILSKERTIVSCNRAFLGLFGYARDEVNGASIRILHTSEQSHASFARRAYSAIAKKGSFRAELDMVAKDGTIVPVETVISAVTSRGNEVTHYVAIIRDMAERKKLETQLLQSQKMEAIGRLAGGIAHDFNNLLTAIMGNAELALYQSRPEDIIHRRIRNIHETAQRASQLTQQLLTLSRRQRVEPRLLNLNHVVEAMREMFAPIIGEDISFHYALEAKPPLIKADPSQVEQVVLNLVVNAREAMLEGGKMTLSTETVTLDDDTCGAEAPPGIYLALRVSDTGHGIPNEMHDHLFEPFYSGKSGGTGLGLSIVYTIVKQSHGHISFATTLGQGTTFSVFFPAAATREKVKTDTQASFDEEMPSGQGMVLVVEDELGILSLVTDVLVSLGYAVFAASSGEEAMAWAEGHHGAVDLLVTDIVLPGKRGTELAVLLREVYKDMKVLFISGHGEDSVNDSYTKENFLSKPFTPLSLAKRVQKILES